MWVSQKVDLFGFSRENRKHPTQKGSSWFKHMELRFFGVLFSLLLFLCVFFGDHLEMRDLAAHGPWPFALATLASASHAFLAHSLHESVFLNHTFPKSPLRKSLVRWVMGNEPL